MLLNIQKISNKNNLLVIILIAIIAIIVPSDNGSFAVNKITKSRIANRISTSNQPKLSNETEFSIIADYKTGAILYGKNIDKSMYPSSMTKIMTTYIAFSAIKNGEISLEQKFTVSQKAASMQGSKMFIQSGTEVEVEELLRGIIIQSGNDACVALAENIMGSEAAFVEQMNAVAKELGMKNTNFTNSSGWPDPAQVTTPRDLAILSRALIHNFPEYYHYHSERNFTYNNISQPNRNTLLSINGVDGIKTGHTEAGGFGVVFSAEKDGHRLIGVVNNLPSSYTRHEAASSLLTRAYAQFLPFILYKKGDLVGKSHIAYGNKTEINVAISSDLPIFIPKNKMMLLKNISANSAPERNDELPEIEVHLMQNVKAPITKGQNMGYISLKQKMLNGEEVKIPLVAAEEITKASFVEYIAQNIIFLIKKFI